MANRSIQMQVKNGPTWDQLFPVTKGSLVQQDPNNRMVTDAQIAAWNAKAETAVATALANGLMSKEAFSKLAGIQDNANNYVLPANHPASMIIEDATHRYVTEVQIAAWDAKANIVVGTDAPSLPGAIWFQEIA